MSEIGSILKNIRIKKGLSLDDVNQQTKIRMHILQAIEDGNYHILPAVYMRAFISDYMKFMDLDENISTVLDEIYPKSEKDILANESTKRISTKENNINYDEIFAPKKKRRDFFNKTSAMMYILYGVILFAVLIILYFAFFNKKDKIDVENIPANNESTQVIADESLIEKSKIEPTDSMNLRILSKDTVWLRLSNDGVSNKQTVLYPGNTLEMKAWEYFTISSDKASSLEIYRNGNILPKLSSQGNAVRNVKITRTDIISPTSVYSDSTVKTRRIKKQVKEKKKETPYILSPSVVN